ncbi:carboxypeptidase regulatory-like domain-containing protein [Candidatus Bathyarchaeota archaeon]|nr:MAG: carboxypeptidase regulatory-like domain-containing protein [Candidatus Bathyarchaeota archaeon]
MKARAPVILFTLLASFLVPLLIGNVYATSGCTSGCQVTVSSNVASSDGTIWVQIDNGTGTYCSSNQCTVSLPQSSPPTFTFANNTIHTITVLSSNTTFTGSSTGGHYVWKEWANYFGTPNQVVWTTNPTLRIPVAGSTGGILYNYTGTAGFTAVFDKQFHYTLSFNDASGNPLSPAPASVSLSAQTAGTTTTITQYSGFLSNDVYTVTEANWEGSTLGTTSSVQIDLTSGSATKTVSLKAYPASVHVVDNNNNPIGGANVTVTFINSTSRSFLTNSKGNVQLGDVPMGTYSLSVMYQNQQVTGLIENAITSPTATVQLNIGSAATSTTTSAIVLLTIFGLAFFLILLAIKVRKPPPPPTI